MMRIVFATLAAASVLFCGIAASAPRTGILLTDAKGIVLYTRNAKTPLVPASTLKILTSLVALEHWGTGYRFTTRFAVDGDNLYVRGFGDPLLISEAIEAACRQVAEKTGKTQIRDIILDQTWFDKDITIPGTGRSLNPYDATTGALCANFNTVYFEWDKIRKQYRSAEPQTPLLPGFDRQIRATGLTQGRILLDPARRLVYPGLLMQYFLNQAGINTTGSVRLGRFPDSAPAPMDLASPYSLYQVVRKLLKFSNNFIANQLMLCLGASQSGPPATLDKGVRAIRSYARDELGLTGLQIAEGSGISRKNRVTPEQMGVILRAFMPYHSLLAQKGNDLYKTGTLSDVRSRAGYLRGGNGRLYPYVIMVNKQGSGYGRILNDLKKKVARQEGGERLRQDPE